MCAGRSLALLLALASAGTGCGAPTKTAGEVGHIFDGTGTSLQDKLSGLCGALGGRQTAPTLNGLDLDVAGCGDAGLAAQDYKALTSFQFLGIEGDIPDAEKEKVIRKTVRSQVWLNRSILGLAAALSGKFQTADNTTGQLIAPDSGKSVQGLIQVQLEQAEPFRFDTEAMELSALLRIKASGVATLDNELRISGKLIDGAFAVTIQTTGDRKLDQSLIKSLSGLVLIVPHASDVYLDMFMDLQVHNVGLSGLFKEVIAGFLADGLKKIADTMLAL